MDLTIEEHKQFLRQGSYAALYLVTTLPWVGANKRRAAHEILAYRLCQELGL